MARKKDINEDMVKKLSELEEKCKITIKKLENDNKRLYEDRETNGFVRCIQVNCNNEKITQIKEMLKDIKKKRGF